MTTKFWMGVLLGILTFAGLLLTTTVMFAVVKLGVFKRSSPIYLISTANLLCDCIQLILAITYLVPSIISDSWLFEGDRHNKFLQFLGAVFLFCWYYGSVAQILMAVNRVCVICIHSNRFFSYRNVLIIVIILFPIAGIVAWISQYVSPCCKISFDHKYLSYSYTAKDDVPNYSNMYIDLPLNSSSSAICAACYVYIILYVRKMRHSYTVDAAENGKRIKEYRYALQFCVISVFYLCGWISFRVFPVLIGVRGLEYFIVVSACVTLNSAANAIVYITSNLEVQHILYNSKVSTPVYANSSPRIVGVKSIPSHHYKSSR
ncbi:unnamed protein product [Cylicocyclus nassatus]|uniref:G-protein coupled receptors family 1 profile domain-containing protein n=1 Tax=Cylicocyclus nassatus TaxID=53992 RepID=A0AA36H357_CYLNA|nr:unnamed protein product [Cylicocyclus nassatus]